MSRGFELSGESVVRRDRGVADHSNETSLQAKSVAAQRVSKPVESSRPVRTIKERKKTKYGRDTNESKMVSKSPKTSMRPTPVGQTKEK